MNKVFVKFENRIIECSLEKGKRKSLYIVIQEDGNVDIRAPKQMNDKQILDFIESKKKWIYKKVLEQEERKNVKINLRNNGKLMLLGSEYSINKKFENCKAIKMEFKDELINLILPLKYENKSNLDEIIDSCYNKLLLKIAKIEVQNSMNRISNLVGIKPDELKIRNFKRSWGNCSSKRIISINKDVCKFSKKAIDYVCLHEVCHLKYMNHSKDFWNMVEKYMPDYKSVEKELR